MRIKFLQSNPLVFFAIFFLLVSGSSLFSSNSYAARPMITDDARIVDGKACQIESWVKNNRDSNEFWVVPACNFNDSLELSLGGARTQDQFSSYTSDMLFQAKILFKPLEKNDWGIGLSAGVIQHPHAEKSGRDLYVSLPASFSFQDDRFVVHANLGWMREQSSQQHVLTWGLGSETQITDRVGLIAESFGQTRGKPLYQAGIRYWVIPERVQIDMTYGNRIGSNNQERWFSLGLRLLSPPFLQ